MARDFDNNTANNLSVDVAAVAVAPLTMACWFRCDLSNSVDGLMWVGDKDVADHFWVLFADGGVAGDPVRMRAIAGGTAQTASTSTGFTAGVWHHACGVEASATSRSAYIDGGSKATNTTSVSPANADRTAIGLFNDSTPSGPHDGRIAEAGIWDVALTDAEVKTLADGVSPLNVRPANLIAYWPLHGNRSPEPNLAGDPALNLTIAGTVAQADHAPVAPPFAELAGWPGAYTAPAAPGGLTPRLALLGAG